MLRKGILILIWMLLLVVPMTAQDSIPMVSEVAANGVAAGDPLLMMDSAAKQNAEPKAKQPIEARVEYTSTDSMVMTGKGVAYMYGKGEVKYQALELTADYIRVCLDNSTLYASGVLDTVVNEWRGLPVFKDANESYDSKEITYNLKAQK